jgi:hypothetical protein
MNEAWLDTVPFIFGIVFVLFSPQLDNLVWRGTYESFYRDYYSQHGSKYGTLLTPENLTSAAAWAVNLAQVVPGVLLAWVGAIVLLDNADIGIAILTMGIAVVPLIAVSSAQRRKDLHTHEMNFVLKRYSSAQLLVLAANLVGLGIAILVAVNSGHNPTS